MWLTILPIFDGIGQETAPADLPLALAPAVGPLGEVQYPTCPLKKFFTKFSQKYLLWAMQTLIPHFRTPRP